MTQRIQEILGNLDELCKKRNELFAALPRAIRIAQLWDDAFKDGLTCSPVLIGINNNRLRKPKYPAPYEKVGTIKRTYLKREDGVEYDISEEDFFSIITAGP